MNEDEEKRDEVLKRMLETKPEPQNESKKDEEKSE